MDWDQALAFLGHGQKTDDSIQWLRAEDLGGSLPCFVICEWFPNLFIWAVVDSIIMVHYIIISEKLRKYYERPVRLQVQHSRAAFKETKLVTRKSI